MIKFVVFKEWRTNITLSNSFDSSLSWLRSLSKVSLSFISDPKPKIVKIKEALLFEDEIKEEEEFSLDASTLNFLYLNQESEWSNTFTSKDPPKAVKINLEFKDENFSKTILIPNWSKEWRK